MTKLQAFLLIEEILDQQELEIYEVVRLGPGVVSLVSEPDPDYFWIVSVLPVGADDSSTWQYRELARYKFSGTVPMEEFRRAVHRLSPGFNSLKGNVELVYPYKISPLCMEPQYC